MWMGRYSEEARRDGEAGACGERGSLAEEAARRHKFCGRRRISRSLDEDVFPHAARIHRTEEAGRPSVEARSMEP